MHKSDEATRRILFMSIGFILGWALGLAVGQLIK